MVLDIAEKSDGKEKGFSAGFRGKLWVWCEHGPQGLDDLLDFHGLPPVENSLGVSLEQEVSRCQDTRGSVLYLHFNH